jgi:hypothetical protein
MSGCDRPINTGYYRNFRGFRPINGYVWEQNGTKGRAVILLYHARFLPRWFQATVAAYRLNRTPGPRHPYPWERS